MTSVETLSTVEPGVWTEVADAAQIAAQRPDAGSFPLAVKANIAVAGFHHSAGCRALETAPATADADVVALLRPAGAVVVGTTNMHELAFGITSDNATYGPVRNPSDPTRSAGGSSGGSAAAVARGDVDVALGTDTGGSMTIPASLCGVVGFRPSTGRWPSGGLVGLSWTRDTPGVFARNVARVEAIDQRVAPAPPQQVDRLPAGSETTVAVPQEFLRQLDPHTERAFAAALERWRPAVNLVELELGEILDLTRAAEGPLVMWESRQLLADAAARALGMSPEAALARLSEQVQSPDVRELLRNQRDAPVSAEQYAAAQRSTARARQLYAERLADAGIDALVFPTTPAPAPRWSESLTISDGTGAVDTFGRFTRHTGLGTVLGAPVVSVPAPVEAGQLPVGIAVQGARFDDARLLAVAAHLEARLRRPA
ncbi:amidase family protein [Zhihengliuella flava]|uniref:Mandelamide amidase n=1 Tax=Zhihengliuella flava TaxID=1285193 RepID=A0A931GFX6_9MICC|nr:amidase family protein [Zhihengliuella flava]MBG6085157.1 mandelamide amidase [Zhihengliuella flava]